MEDSIQGKHTEFIIHAHSESMVLLCLYSIESA